ncbi:MAG: hypothetical protein KF767_12780 [Bdellovibrionaceae bacterium]|nr:hypothetical protein [Pseudobdellovibrionaceae bacterium]
MTSLLMAFVAALGIAWSAPRGHGVGNGGDGYYFPATGDIFVRDLFESGLHLSKIPPGEVDNRFLRYDWPMLQTDRERLTMAIKLTELNRALPGFGDTLSSVAESYTWLFIDTPLAIVEHEEGLIDAVEGAEVRQLAIRLGTIIRIHRDSWNRMTDENRIALVFHELIEALLSPHPRDDGSWAQSNLKARELTGLLFHPQIVDQGPRLMRHSFMPTLELPWTELRNYRNLGPQPLRLGISRNGHRSTTWSIARINRGERRQATREICALTEKDRERFSVGIELEGRLRPYSVEMKSYSASFGQQNYSVVRERASATLLQMKLNASLPGFHCERDLTEVLSQLSSEI